MNVKFLLSYLLLGLFASANSYGLAIKAPLPSESLSFVTFNVGLARFYVGDYTLRRQLILDRLNTLDDDVICLQEVWRSEDLAEYTEKLAARYPFVYYRTTKKSWFLSNNDGLMILSRLPIIERAEIKLDSFLFQRRALWVKVQAGERQLGIACSHLSAKIHGLPYWGKFDSVEDEQVGQVQAILSSFQPLDILLGDWNSGPSIGEHIKAFSPSPYEATIAAGYVSPAVEDSSPRCTWCEENPLVEKGYGDLLIDHVFLHRSIEAQPIVVETIFTEEIDAGPRKIRLSDHYGVRVRIVWSQ